MSADAPEAPRAPEARGGAAAGGGGAVADRRLHPTTLVSGTLRAIPNAAGGMAAYAAIIRRAEAVQIVSLIGFGLALAAGIAFLTWWRFRYGVGDREIVIESGVIRRRRRVIPFERVQDIAIERRLLARLFGTAHVRIETGGSAKDEGHLDSIALADAEELRDHIRRRAAAPGSAPASSASEEAATAESEPVLFAMGPWRVVLFGTFNFSLVFVAAIFALLQNVEEWGFFDPYDAAPGAVERLKGGWIAATLLLALAVVVLGFAAGIVRTLARDFGFRLTRAPNGLRRRRGLLTLSEAVIPIRKIQLAIVSSGIVMRALGWQRLDFQTLGADPKERGAQVAAPFARPGEVRPILAETGFPDERAAGEWRRGPARSLVRRGLAPLLGALAMAAVAWWIQPWNALAAAFLMILALLAPLRWHRHRHALGEKALFVRGGVLTHRMKVMPYERAQAISVTQGPVQRLLGLASVRVDTAGAPAAGGLAVRDLWARDAAALAGRLLDLFRARRTDARARLGSQGHGQGERGRARSVEAPSSSQGVLSNGQSGQ
ncbi:MAG TPA: PH domain-containing protein [Allosphingosinicella sp.]